MRRRTARCGRSGSAAAGRPGLSRDPRTSRYPHASPAIERRPGLSVAARSAASRCGISCAHRGQVTGLPASPGSAAASIASAQARAAAASCAGSRSRTMAWVSRCITSPRWSMRASDCQASRRRVCCQASGSAARAASSPGRSPGTLVNRSSGTGSGARNAHTPASWAAAGSSSASRSAISPVAAASDCGYDPGIASSSSCPARVASRSRYWTALMPVSAMNPPACTTANGRSPSWDGSRPASSVPSPGTRWCKRATDSSRASTSTSTGAATSAHVRSREVISTWPAPPGSHPVISAGFSALSKTSSHRPRWRRSASTAARTSSVPAPGWTQPSAAPRAANWSPISPPCSALTHQPSS